MSIAVLGGGIAGISAAYHLQAEGREAVVYEQNASWGGLCDNFTIDGFRFDNAVHLSFTKDEHVKELFDLSSASYSHPPLAYNYYQGYWLKHPAQNNSFPLATEEKIRIIMDFINREESSAVINDYEQWLRYQYGNYFAENFPMRYTRKYWTVEARDLTTSWVGNRMYRPSVEEVLAGAMSADTPNTYYAQMMRYPEKGGYKAYLSYMAERTHLCLNKKAVLIDPQKKRIDFEDGDSRYYDHLISSLPLPDLVKLIKNSPAPVQEAGEAICASSVALVSLGFNSPDIPKYLWFYIYDEDVPPSRVYSPSMKSPDNVPPGKSSFQCEIYFSKYKPLVRQGDDLLSYVIEKGIACGWFCKNDIEVSDYRELKYGNVIFHKGMEKSRQIIHDFLDGQGIVTVGRFGEWAFLWSDQSLLSGQAGAARISRQNHF